MSSTHPPVSSFQKSKAKVIDIPGTRLSSHNSQLLTSSGVSSLDFLLGGGIPVGSLLLIEEDFYNVYSQLLLKFFLAEGVINGHFLHFCSLDCDVEDVLNSLPGPSTDDEAAPCKAGEEMKIAWRYQNQSNESNVKNRFASEFDISKQMSKDRIEREKISFWGGLSETDDKSFHGSLYWLLIESIKQRMQALDLFSIPNKKQSNLFRIVIPSLLSPLWGAEDDPAENWNHVTKAVLLLRALVRSSYSCAVISIPSHLFENSAVLSRLHGLVDFVVRLESFEGSAKEKNPVYKDYHGLFHVKKLSPINSLVVPQLDALDWAFRIKKKRFVIEKLHLPPDLSETANRAQIDHKTPDKVNHSRDLEF